MLASVRDSHRTRVYRAAPSPLVYTHALVVPAFNVQASFVSQLISIWPIWICNPGAKTDRVVGNQPQCAGMRYDKQGRNLRHMHSLLLLLAACCAATGTGLLLRAHRDLGPC